MKAYPALVAAALLAACTPAENTSVPPASTGKQLVATTIPAKFQGVWTTNASGKPSGENPTEIRATTWRGHESFGRVKSVRINGENDITVTRALTGEGTEWVDRVNLRLSPDGNVLTMGGASGQSGVPLYRVR
jgi:hypothetical protein